MLTCKYLSALWSPPVTPFLHPTFVFDSVEANGLAVSPQQFAALCARVQGEERPLLWGPLHHLTQQEHNHPLHDWLHLGNIQEFSIISSQSDNVLLFNQDVLKVFVPDRSHPTVFFSSDSLFVETSIAFTSLHPHINSDLVILSSVSVSANVAPRNPPQTHTLTFRKRWRMSWSVVSCTFLNTHTRRMYFNFSGFQDEPKRSKKDLK